jgi:MFS superfamily sulfate permease-like transporter
MLSFKTWRQDAQSSLVVFLVALPLCLGIALASGAPLAAGLYAGIIGGLVVGSLSGSQISVSGPAAGLTVIVLGAIKELGSFEAFTLAVFFSGIIQIIFGSVRAGSIGNYFPTSVIKGMLAAIGIILILKQFPHAIGYDADFMGDESFNQPDGQNTFSEIVYSLNWLAPGALIISMVSIGLMLFWEKMAVKKIFFRLVPGALVAVVASLVINEIFKNFVPSISLGGNHLVQLPFSGGMSDFVAGFKTPDWSYITQTQVYISAFTIAIVGSLESLLSVDAADKLETEGNITNKNRELFAQGVGNTVSGFIGGLPITAVIVRTSANAAAGARSNLSAVLHGVWLLLCVVSIPHLLNKIPLAALATVLILVGYKLTRPALYRSLFAKGPNQFIPFIVTIVAILFTDLLIGILIGMVVGFVFVFRANMHKSIVMVQDKDNYLIKFYKDVSFLQKSTLMKLLDSIPSHSSVMIDGSQNVFVDDDIVELIEDYKKRSVKEKINVELRKSSLALNPLFRKG